MAFWPSIKVLKDPKLQEGNGMKPHPATKFCGETVGTKQQAIFSWKLE
jgi:hypothetical protein